MRHFLLLLVCISGAWLATAPASAAPARRFPAPGNHRPVYTYYHGSSRTHHKRSLLDLFRRHKGGTKTAPHHSRGTR
ncbi:hypothetical protein ACFQ48_13975 [Hymenobacter caeli]|uniref:Secreted protein n=1 Tax=Hymenobacter caeli TaxID=2735894 RepID=A0ABX2FTF7_9BACT|nr:hypothetical protein [Hymenobacter caeli]NRT20475.1 hypothetical protein [Hymenobacter caeli]